MHVGAVNGKGGISPQSRWSWLFRWQESLRLKDELGIFPLFFQHILFRHFMLFVKVLSIFFSAQEQSLYVPRSLSEINDRDEGVLV